jgi:hypothetical protein
MPIESCWCNCAYRACLTKQLLGVGDPMQSATTGIAVSAGVTTAWLPTNPLPVREDDVVCVYAQGLAGDTSVGVVTEVFDAGGLTAQEVRDALKLAPTAGTPAAGSVDAHLDSLLLYGGGSGTGVYTDTVTDGVDPLNGVRVQLSTDVAGTHRVYEAFTNASGVFTLHPDPGTYYRWIDYAGFNSLQGVQVIVA